MSHKYNCTKSPTCTFSNLIRVSFLLVSKKNQTVSLRLKFPSLRFSDKCGKLHNYSYTQKMQFEYPFALHTNLLFLEIYQTFSLVCRLSRYHKNYTFSWSVSQSGSCINFHIRPKFMLHKFCLQAGSALICKCSEIT